MRPLKLVIIIPAYNESEMISAAISQLRQVADKLESEGLKTYLFVVDDGSQDNTRMVAKDAGADRVVIHKVNMGLGAAVRTGLTAARADEADIVVKIDADLQHDPDDIFPLIQPILEDEADVVYGNRFEKIEYKMPCVRRIGNTVFIWLMRWLTKWPIKDSQPGIFAVNRSYLDVFYMPGDYNYTQQILIDAYHNGMRFSHVPVSFRKRSTGKSFVSLKYPLRVLPQIIQVLIGVKPMRIFLPIGLAFLFIGLFVFGWNIVEWLLGNSNKPVRNVNAVLGCGFFGLQTCFFGFLADLIVKLKTQSRRP
jgi:glycosyltransferase involved in cell wall biosynthesis